jgi:hypothetical protein
MAYWVYLLAAASGPAAVVVWKFAPRAFLMIVGGLTGSPQRSRQCAEMIRLSRGDAKDLPSYFPGAPVAVESSPGEPGTTPGGDVPDDDA